MKNNYLISIVVPTYNTGSLFLNDCLNSIYNQKYTNFEVIIVDGYSTDDTYDCAKKWADRDSRFKAIQHEKGASKQRNAGIDNSNGDFIAFIDSDDYISDDYFEKMIENVSDSIDVYIPRIVFVLYDGNQNVIQAYSDYQVPQGLVTDKNFFINLQKNGLVSPVKMYRKSAIKNIRFRADLNYGEDLLFNFSIAQSGVKYYHSKESLYFYRRIKGSNSGIKRLNKNSLRIIPLLYKLTKQYKKGDQENYRGIYQEFCNDFELFYYACVKTNNTKFIIQLFKYRLVFLKAHHSLSEVVYLLFPYTYKFLKKLRKK